MSVAAIISCSISFSVIIFVLILLYNIDRPSITPSNALALPSITLPLSAYEHMIRTSPRLSENIPKKIWTFWNDDIVPTFISNCINTWQKCCDDYEIVILTPARLPSVIQNICLTSLPFADTPKRLSDFVRLHVLFEYGGFWVDASTIMLDSLDYFRDKQIANKVELVGYYIESFTTLPNYPVIENWFFGCVPHSVFVGLWRDTFMKINLFHQSDKYVDCIRQNNTCLQDIQAPDYLTMHIAAQDIMQHFPTSALMALDKAEDGPLKYLVDSQWDSLKAIELLPSIQNDTTIFIKLRGSERVILQERPALCQQIFSPPAI